MISYITKYMPLSIFMGNRNTPLFWPSSSKWGIHLAAIPLTRIFLRNLICWSSWYAQASSYLTSSHSCINLQQIIYLASYLRGNNTCRPASDRCTVNRLYSRLKAFNLPGNSWIRASTMPFSGTISLNIALALISSLLSSFYIPSHFSTDLLSHGFLQSIWMTSLTKHVE